MWAGVGTGTNTDPLYQAGVRLECTDGTSSSHVWWEAYTPSGGAGAAEQDYSGRTVSAGDKIVVQVAPYSGSSTNVNLAVYDYGPTLSNGSFNWIASHNIVLDTPAAPSTVECIVERPSTSSGFTDLIDFGTVDFSTASSGSPNQACNATANGIDHAIASNTYTYNHGVTGTAIDMQNSAATTLASTSAPSTTGYFDVTWHAGS